MTAALSFLGGLGALLIAGHLVVRASSTIGVRFGLTPNVIGLTIVAAGTSAPELAVVFQAVAADDTELAVGSIIGSNIANVLLVLGIAALIGTIQVTSRVVRIDIPVMIVTSALLLVFVLDGNLAQLEGVVLVIGVVVFTTWTLRVAGRNGAAGLNAAAVALRPVGEGANVDADANADADRADDGSARTEPGGTRRRGLGRSGLELAVGIAALAIAARFVVAGAEDIAASLGVPELIIGLTIVALGTSAPEIVTTLIAAVQGQRDLAVGNAVGSNIFNILLVLGSTSSLTAGGIGVSEDAVNLDLPIMVAAAFACLPLMAWDRKLDRWEGAVFLTYYGAYLLFLILDATGHRAKDPFALIMVGFVLPLTVITLATIGFRRRSRIVVV
ncbi:MAG: calcium/sodium antiporter [Acidimicrobiales bacterium]